MARVEEASDTDDASKNVTTKGKAAFKSQSERADEENEVSSNEDGVNPPDDSEGGEEYEIDEILDAKKGRFPGGQMGYFVSWKGYPPEENCWISEADAGNAQDLIDEFWARRKAEKKARKPTEAKAPAKPRKSWGKGDSAPKKRGRKSGATADSDDEPLEAQPSKKKSRNANRASNAVDKPKSSRTPVEHDESSDEEVPIGDMKKYMTVASWEHIVAKIDTVERTEDGDLDVYFRLSTTQERVKEKSDVCAQRFPQKLIKFYESNLRWKTSEGPDDD